MRAPWTDADSDLSYSSEPPVLIAGDSEASRSRAMATVATAGLRVAANVGLAEAPERMRRQAAAAAIWLELDSDGGAAMDAALDQLGREVEEGRWPAVVAGRSAFLDALAARASAPGIELVVDGSESERLAALALATSGAHSPTRVADARNDQESARLRQLSDEVSRIAATLARLSSGPGAAPSRPAEAAAAAPVPDVSVDTVRTVIRSRRLRARYFPEELFADPAWDMLLDLLQAELAQLRVPVSSLCIAAAVPATTALRWLKTMTDQGLFVRRADPHDGRRVFVELAPHASVAMKRYFAEVGTPVTV